MFSKVTEVICGWAVILGDASDMFAVRALVGVIYKFGMIIYGFQIWREVEGMAVSEIHALEGSYTEPGSNVVLTETS